MTTPESIRDTDRTRLPGHWRAGIRRIIETQVEFPAVFRHGLAASLPKSDPCDRGTLNRALGYRPTVYTGPAPDILLFPIYAQTQAFFDFFASYLQFGSGEP